MRPLEDKGSLNNVSAQEISAVSCMSFDFHRRNGIHRASSSRTALGKPTPWKWDDAQKWLVNLSRGEKNQLKGSAHSSNADGKRLIVPAPKKGDFSSEEGVEMGCHALKSVSKDEVELKNVDCDESVWRIKKPVSNSISNISSICVRDMGTDMTPDASQEPSRTTTPIRTTTSAANSPTASESSAPVNCQNGEMMAIEHNVELIETKNEWARRVDGSTNAATIAENNKTNVHIGILDELELKAVAWDEAERAKHMARFKREELKIQAWENHQKRRAEMKMRKIEAKAERLKSRAQEKYTNKLAATRRIAEERRACAEAILNEKAVTTSEKADYIRRTGRLPSRFIFKRPSFCW